MEVKIDIKFEQLPDLIKQLPEKDLLRLKSSLNENEEAEIDKYSKMNLQEFILKAPVFSAKQIRKVKEARNILKWRAK